MGSYLALVQRQPEKISKVGNRFFKETSEKNTHIDKGPKSMSSFGCHSLSFLILSKLHPRLLTHYIKRKAVLDDLVGTE